MPVVVVSIMMMLLSAWAYLSADSIQAAKAQRLSVLSDGRALIASEVNRYHLETGVWPSNLEALSAVPGFEHLKSYVTQANKGGVAAPNTPWKIVLSNVLSNGVIQYQRAAVLAIPDASDTLTSYLSSTNNKCNPSGSTLDFYSANAWCGSNKGYWSTATTGEFKALRERMAYQQQKALANKLIRRYKTTANFPVVATATELRALVTASDMTSSVGLTVAECSGTFHWQGFGVECSDLYNQFGNPVRYRWVAAKQFQLTSTSQIKNASGTALTLTTNVTMP